MLTGRIPVLHQRRLNCIGYLDESPVLIFDSPKLKEIIIDEGIYEQFQIGDIVYLEVTHRTREILRIDKVP